MSCTSVDLYKSILKCAGQRYLPGIRPKVYFILKENIAAWPSVVNEVTTDMGDIAKTSGNFTLAASKKWQRLDLVDLKSNFHAASQGEAPSKTFLTTVTLVVGGTGEEITGFMKASNNDSLVFLVQQRDGKFRLVGNEAYDVNTSSEQDSGAAITDQAQSTVSLSVTDDCPCPFYTGKIETVDDGDISGEDGSAWSN